MSEISVENGAKRAPSRLDARAEATTKAARDIIGQEAAARIAKTERLRAARLAQEAAAPPPDAAKAAAPASVRGKRPA